MIFFYFELRNIMRISCLLSLIKIWGYFKQDSRDFLLWSFKKHQGFLYYLLNCSDSSSSSLKNLSLEVPLMVTVIARATMYANNSNFWWKAKLYAR